ncbi:MULTISPECIES: single-stranded-DNA-specific exonuclease RecJ [unclassified Uliginosibacterium]|uniref:single-stranded-DNA-specific exonuclease RecJ n=1 Tax=unclassified Uliginosibacterium TaxID=2621521 RepID=UPI000C7CEB74|nr:MULTISPECIES: single-stranded-DNA-specific exonuclease RecJ [unclassified Uliginosibacterium]MDO6386875.1 single-stranded-DNA-specific exonuclease RecJ [Uliginosibacterium sp. 31-12]PLK49567.1 single-stranded-DNA-specific exonuclease RecJ [Uliginosibacterium sp. TH139]
MTRLIQRQADSRTARQLQDAGLHPLLARLYAARGIHSASELKMDLAGLLPPEGLKGIADAARLLADAIEAQARMVIVADYDCDGATACAVGIRALRLLGAKDVHYFVPDRVVHGYGLSPSVVADVARLEADILITVDNGIASVEGVAAAQALGMTVLVTDHHLPGDTLPTAEVIVNPNQPGCTFESKNLAGVGVMFYTALALRAELRQRGIFTDANPAPNLASLLDLVALGTVADVVKLDPNNRLLVRQGINRMRSDRMCAGIRALFAMAGRNPARATPFDMGFALGPRLNAAGRLSDMSLGIECLITDDYARAFTIAQELQNLNVERREIEAEMRDAALATLDATRIDEGPAIALFEPEWHQGVIGIVAGRIKDQAHRPTIAFARASEREDDGGEIKGSGRSIPALHLRDALDLITKRHPDLILKFGGHAMAAGLTIRERDFTRFRQIFADTVAELVPPNDLQRTLETDGALETGYMSLETARLIDDEIWGQGFAAPLFEDVFEVKRQRLMKERHLKLELAKPGAVFEAVRFNCAENVPARIRAAYRLSSNEWQGVQSLQLMLEYFEPA